MAARRPATDYRVRVTLIDVDPPVWREVLVPGDLTLRDLHEVLQIILGWNDSHLHLFEYGGRKWSNPEFELDVEAEMETEDEGATTLRKLFSTRKARAHYEYDFGDNWQHVLEVEPATQPVPIPRCTRGARACPPDDVGGTYGYGEFLEAIADPGHESHDDMLTWVGGAFDPEAFDAAQVNRELARWARRRRG